MKGLLLTLLACLTTLISFGQGTAADAAATAPSSAGSGDTVAVGKLINKALESLASDPTAAFAAADQAVSMADQLGVMEAKYRAYKTLGNVNWELGKFGDAFFQFDRARRLVMVEAPGDSVKNAEIYLLTGRLNAARENYPGAVELFNQSLRFTSIRKNQAAVMAVLIEKGKALNAQNDSTSAYDAFNQVIAMHAAAPNKAMAGTAYNELGKIAMAKRQFPLAEKHFDAALAAVEQDKADPLFVLILGNKSLLEIKKGDLNKALAYRKEELAIVEKSGAQEALANSYACLGDIYLKLENLGQAEIALKKALTIAERLHRNSPIGAIFKGLADVFAKKGDYKQAFYFFRRYAEHQDSLHSAEKVRRIYDQATQHALDGKDKEIEAEKNKNKIKEQELQNKVMQRNALIGFAVMSMIILVIGAIGLVQNRRASAKLQQKNLMIQNQNKIILEKNKILEDRNDRMVQLHTEKNNIIRVVSHDLKAPLNRINGLSQLIQIDPENQPMYLKYIADVVADGTRLIQDLLDISAIENNRLMLRKSLFNLSDDLTEVVNSYVGVATKKGLDIRLDVPDQDLILYSDRYAIRRVFENLLSNAVKFSPKERTIFIRIFRNNTKLCIAVKDQGPGLTDEDKEKLYTPYQRLSASPTAGENSTGLGLSIAKRLMEELQGDLWVESSEGNGACFVVELPDQREPDENDLEIAAYTDASVKSNKGGNIQGDLGKNQPNSQPKPDDSAQQPSSADHEIPLSNQQ